MLWITIPEIEYWDELKCEFLKIKEQTIQLEHSLIAISKWESKWCKSFLDTKQKTYEETVDYIKCMTIAQKMDPKIYNNITDDNLEEINKYIGAPMTATWFPKDNTSGNKEIITSELIYYWMVSFNIPFECEKWHLNRLLALIKVCSIKNAPKKKMKQSEIMARNAALNEERRKKLNTKG